MLINPFEIILQSLEPFLAYKYILTILIPAVSIKSDGSIVGWGDNRYGQARTPVGNDFIAITVIEPLEAELRILPHVINKKSQGRFIIVALQLPAGITKDDIDDEYPLTMCPCGIEATRKQCFTILRKHLPCPQSRCVAMKGSILVP